ncbi:hypothetical protein Vadar_013883 [Vaccinium darrowii]|uniref:Uncharacterized protein n=1 Tax=Vaccinium darrowii TaxID=229202 RepID=A0ACB7X0N7_9ERIC|nr:hypothetical protein Vadar_013883 [Vaccinium darrowii]
MLLLCMVMVEGRSSPNGGGLNVLDFGAVGNGQTDDSQVFGKIMAPSKKNFHSGTKEWLTFDSVNGLIVNGNGDIDGYGSSWWGSCDNGNECSGRPTALKFNNCNYLQVSGVSITNAQHNHISLSNCADVTIFNIKITAPDNTPNTDGIDISHSTRVQIQNSDIGTGDDCIAINTGCSYINITGINCGPGHGISIGSLGEDHSEGIVEEVHVVGCTFTGTQNGARIKTWQGGSGYVRKVSFKDITLYDSMNPILIDQYYCDDKECKNQTSAVSISDVSFIGFTGTSATEAAVQLLCSKSVGCDGILLDRINITTSHKQSTEDKVFSECINAHGTSSGSNIPNVPCLLH